MLLKKTRKTMHMMGLIAALHGRIADNVMSLRTTDQPSY